MIILSQLTYPVFWLQNLVWAWNAIRTSEIWNYNLKLQFQVKEFFFPSRNTSRDFFFFFFSPRRIASDLRSRTSTVRKGEPRRSKWKTGLIVTVSGIGKMKRKFPFPGTEESGGLPSMGSHRVGHDWRDLAAAACNAPDCACRKLKWMKHKL